MARGYTHMARGYIQTEIFGSFGDYHLRLNIKSHDGGDVLVLNADEIQEVIDNLDSYKKELIRINKPE